MAAVNACFEPDNGAAVTNGRSQLQQPVSGTSTAQTAQQEEGIWSGNNRFDTTNGISCMKMSVCSELLLVFYKVWTRIFMVFLPLTKIIFGTSLRKCRDSSVVILKIKRTARPRNRDSIPDTDNFFFASP
jgi:hypothetical protein